MIQKINLQERQMAVYWKYRLFQNHAERPNWGGEETAAAQINKVGRSQYL